MEEVKRKPPKKQNIFLRGLAFLITLALVVGAIFLVVNRDRINFDSFKRWFTYRTMATSQLGTGTPFPYQGGSSAAMTLLDGDLLTVSDSGIRLYSPNGIAYLEETVPMKNPACHVAGKTAVVYDAGGTTLRVYRERTNVFSSNDLGGTILSARLNQNGQLAVVTRQSGYKGVVTVYDTNLQATFLLRLSSAFVLDALVSPDGKSLLTVTASQTNQVFSSTLALYPIADTGDASPLPSATLPLGSGLVLDYRWEDGGLRMIHEYGTISANSALEEVGSHDWSDRYLKQFSLQGDDFTAVLVGKYRGGSQTELTVFDRKGALLGSLPLSEPVLSLTAAGRYLAVLTASNLEIYTKDLTLYHTTANLQGAKKAVVRPDGTVLLAASDTAWLYLPTD